MGFDNTLINLAIAVDEAATPEQELTARTQFSEALDSNGANGYVDLIGSMALSYTDAYRASSLSSNTLSLGLKTFVRVRQSIFPWLSGTQVTVIDSNDSTNQMTGVVDSTTTNSQIVIDVQSIEGEGDGIGPIAAWDIYIGGITNVVTTPPLDISQGGTSSTSTSGARESLSVGGFYDVSLIAKNPSEAVSIGLFGRPYVLVSGDPDGAFAGQENKIGYTPDGGLTWEFTTLTRGSQIYVRSTGKTLVADSEAGNLFVVDRFTTAAVRQESAYTLNGSFNTINLETIDPAHHTHWTVPSFISTEIEAEVSADPGGGTRVFTITVNSQSTGSCRVTRAGADTINNADQTFQLIYPGESYTFMASGGSVLYITSSHLP